MFLLKIGVPVTCFEIALTMYSSKGQTLDTGRIHQEQLVDKVLQFPHERIANLAKRKAYNNRSSGQVCLACHHLTGS